MFSNSKKFKSLFHVNVAYANPNSRFLIRITIINTLWVAYTLFALPFYVAYGIDLNPEIIILETLGSFLCAFNIYLKINSFRKQFKLLKTKPALLQFILKTDFIFDFIGLLPLYLLLSRKKEKKTFVKCKKI